MSLSTLDIKDFKVLVSIDFGTTYSGCAYKNFANTDAPKLLDKWPDHQGHYAKTPTLNLYKKTRHGLEMVTWGFSSKAKALELEASDPNVKLVHLFQYKLHLDETARIQAWKHDITVLQAISDFLKAFHDCAAEKIESQTAVNRKYYRYCLTVPAMWSDKAKGIMRQSAIKAGIISEHDHPDRLMLVSEPEAAALYCERTCKEYDLTGGDRFLICDAGGGTVDLIVYDITGSGESRTLAEVTKGHGASCGSMFIDLNFATLLIDRFASQRVKIPDDILTELVDTFAYQLKPNFEGDNDMRLPLPWNAFFSTLKNPSKFDIQQGKMVFKASELKEKVFGPVVSQVLELIRDQLNKANGRDRTAQMSAIFLVGGFASSIYLQNRVRQEFEDKVRIIVTPNRPEMAVVYGAVYAGMDPKKVTARATRRCYGVGVSSPFDWDLDSDHLELKTDLFGRTMCRDRFDTFVTRGQKVKKDECITRAYVIYHKDNNGAAFHIPIFGIDGDPPRYITDLEELAFIGIPDPFSSSDAFGSKMDCTVSFYFGLSEIRAEATVQGKTFVTRLQFNSTESVSNHKLLLYRDAAEF